MNILMVNAPYSGHVNPTLPLARELVKRGHSVQYVCAEEFRNKIKNTGAEFIPYINYPACPNATEKKKFCFQAAFDTAMTLRESFDLLIYEMFFYPGIQIARLRNIPCVRQFSQAAWSERTIEHANVFLTHCGMNSVNEAIQTGVPMVAMPFLNDQIIMQSRL